MGDILNDAELNDLSWTALTGLWAPDWVEFVFIGIFQIGSSRIKRLYPSQRKDFPHVHFSSSTMKPNALRNQKDVNKYFIQVFSVCAILAYFPWHLGEKCTYLLLTIISPRSYIIHGAILRGAWTHSSLSQPHYSSAWSLWKEIQIYFSIVKA